MEGVQGGLVTPLLLCVREPTRDEDESDGCLKLECCAKFISRKVTQKTLGHENRREEVNAT
jgi:hypothetical protein